MVFPSYVALSAHIKDINSTLYLTYKPNNGFLQFSKYAEVPSLIAKFVVEECAGNNLVHIRSCYKNKYLCRESRCSDYIAAVANQPEEDRSKQNCTLFRPTWLGPAVEFTHVTSGLGLSCYYNNNSSSWNLSLGRGVSLQLKVVDFGTLVRFPKRVIFKGDNEKYLRGHWRKARPYLGGLIGIIQYETSAECEYNEFTADNGADRSAHYEITHYNGFVRVKSLHFGKFLRASKDAGKIYGDENETDFNVVDALFEVNTLGKNAINLRNLGKNRVCRRMSTQQVDDCLFASEYYGVPESRLVVEEPVSYRRIHVRYRLQDARVINQNFVPMINKRYTNNSKDKDDVHTISFKYQKSKTTTWSTSTTITNGKKAEINLLIPKVGGARMELSEEYSRLESFAEGFTSLEEVSTDHQITVPPTTTAIIKGYVKKVTYDIPFSYFQTVVYTTGEREENVVEDGVCHGVETCEHFEKTYVRP